MGEKERKKERKKEKRKDTRDYQQSLAEKRGKNHKHLRPWNQTVLRMKSIRSTGIGQERRKKRRTERKGEKKGKYFRNDNFKNSQLDH